MLSFLCFSFTIILWQKKDAAADGFVITSSSPYRIAKQRCHQRSPLAELELPNLEFQLNDKSKEKGFSSNVQKKQNGNSLLCYENAAENKENSRDCRRFFLLSIAATASCTIATISAASATTEPFMEPNERKNESILRQGKDYGYMFQAPSNFRVTRKPIQTHLDELNLEPSSQDGQEESKSSLLFGITVDPVRINSLTEFGTPEQVAARVVTAELNRDGIFEVTLDRANSYTDTNGRVYYTVDYVSEGKRGRKRFLTRTCIADQKLYVATAQIKEAEYQKYQLLHKEIDDALNSFMVTGPSKI